MKAEEIFDQVGSYQNLTKKEAWFDSHGRKTLQGLLHAVDWQCINVQKDLCYSSQLQSTVQTWI